MCRANKQKAKVVKDCFDSFCSMAGQEANAAKSSIFFPKNTAGAERMAIKNILDFKEMLSDSMYLSNNLILSRN